MREIMFKGKRVDNGEWVEGYFYYPIIGEKNVPCIIPCGELARTLVNSRIYQVDPETVCQYIGLTDKNRKKIFEGDIVKLADYDEDASGKVAWNKEKACFEIVDIDNCTFSLEEPEELKIVGNIFDNPDLLITSSTSTDSD